MPTHHRPQETGTDSSRLAETKARAEQTNVG